MSIFEFFKKRKNQSGQNFKTTVQSSKFLLGYIWHKKEGKGYVILKSVIYLLNSLLPIALIYMPGLIINELTGERRADVLAMYVGITTAIPLLQTAVISSLNALLNNLYFKFYYKITADFLAHSADMDYKVMEDPDMEDLRSDAQSTAGGSLDIIDLLGELASSVISIIACASVISILNPLLLIVVIFSVVFNYYTNKAANARDYEVYKKTNRFDRGSTSVLDIFRQARYAKEIRLFGFRDYLIDMYREKRRMSREVYGKNLKYNARDSILGGIVAFAQNAVLYIYFVHQVVSGRIAVGSLLIYIGLVLQFTSSISGITRRWLRLSDLGLRARDFINFMSLPLDSTGSGELNPVFDSESIIEFKNVCFKYPGSDIYALKNLNLTVRCGQRLCIVGENGSGKSTFVKLLMRLYVPCEGEILLNGININEYDYSEYLRLFAPVFQDYNLYNLTLGDNIVMADGYDKERMVSAAEQSGAARLAEKNTKGYDTVIYKMFDADGIEPSGGEGQRIAIARALYHGGKMYILDEPTAALDPNAEYEIYTQFHNMINGKTAIIITHRLSAVQLADKVAVFADGHVAEYGTHAELYAKGGIYTEMFDKQAQFYRDEADIDGIQGKES